GGIGLARQLVVEHLGRFGDVIVHADEDHVFHLHGILPDRCCGDNPSDRRANQRQSGSPGRSVRPLASRATKLTWPGPARKFAEGKTRGSAAWPTWFATTKSWSRISPISRPTISAWRTSSS